MIGRMGMFDLPFSLRLAAGIKGAPSGEAPPFGGTDADLAAINAARRIATDRTSDNTYVRVGDVISTAPLKNGLRLRKEGVEAIVNLAVGSPLLCNHDRGKSSGIDGLPVGWAFRSEMVEQAGEYWARFYFAIPRTQVTQELVARVDGGAISELSAGFAYEGITCGICNGDMDICAHMPNTEYDNKVAYGYVENPQEYYETSLVWMGMANDTRLRIAASRHCDVLKKVTQQKNGVMAWLGPFEDDVVAKVLGL